MDEPKRFSLNTFVPHHYRQFPRAPRHVWLRVCVATTADACRGPQGRAWRHQARSLNAYLTITRE